MKKTFLSIFINLAFVNVALSSVSYEENNKTATPLIPRHQEFYKNFEHLTDEQVHVTFFNLLDCLGEEKSNFVMQCLRKKGIEQTPEAWKASCLKVRVSFENSPDLVTLNYASNREETRASIEKLIKDFDLTRYDLATSFQNLITSTLLETYLNQMLNKSVEIRDYKLLSTKSMLEAIDATKEETSLACEAIGFFLLKSQVTKYDYFKTWLEHVAVPRKKSSKLKSLHFELINDHEKIEFTTLDEENADQKLKTRIALERATYMIKLAEAVDPEFRKMTLSHRFDQKVMKGNTPSEAANTQPTTYVIKTMTPGRQPSRTKEKLRSKLAARQKKAATPEPAPLATAEPIKEAAPVTQKEQQPSTPYMVENLPIAQAITNITDVDSHEPIDTEALISQLVGFTDRFVQAKKQLATTLLNEAGITLELGSHLNYNIVLKKRGNTIPTTATHKYTSESTETQAEYMPLIQNTIFFSTRENLTENLRKLFGEYGNGEALLLALRERMICNTYALQMLQSLLPHIPKLTSTVMTQQLGYKWARDNYNIMFEDFALCYQELLLQNLFFKGKHGALKRISDDLFDQDQLEVMIPRLDLIAKPVGYDSSVENYHKYLIIAGQCFKTATSTNFPAYYDPRLEKRVYYFPAVCETKKHMLPVTVLRDLIHDMTSDLTLQRDDLEKKVTSLQSANQLFAGKLKEEKALTTQQEKQINEHSKNIESTRLEAKNESDKLKNRIEKLTKKLSNLRSTSESHKQEHMQSLEENKKLVEKCLSTQNTTMELKQDLTKACEELQTQQVEREVIEEQLATSRQMLTDLKVFYKKKIAELENEIRANKEDLEKARQLELSQQYTTESQKKTDEAPHQLTQLKEELASKDMTIRSLSNHATMLTTRIQAADAYIQQLLGGQIQFLGANGQRMVLTYQPMPEQKPTDKAE